SLRPDFRHGAADGGPTTGTFRCRAIHRNASKNERSEVSTSQSMPDFLQLAWPLGFHEWMPQAQAATLGLLTFVQEDVPTVSAALLAAAGHLSWQLGFLGVFLGIWIGDALLYLLARACGRPLLQRAWARRFFDPAAVARSEEWFAEKGTWLLL